jgi:hypothetical protein
MKSCFLEIILEKNEVLLDVNTYADSSPEKDENGNWKPILIQFDYDKCDKRNFQNTITEFTESDFDPTSGNVMLSIDDDNWLLYNVRIVKSLKIDKNKKFEFSIQFDNAILDT